MGGKKDRLPKIHYRSREMGKGINGANPHKLVADAKKEMLIKQQGAIPEKGSHLLSKYLPL